MNTFEQQDTSSNKPIFTIKDNVLIGKQLQYPEDYHNVGDIVLEIFEKKPNLVGQIDARTGRKVTYKEMREKSIKCAIWLKQQGVKEGEVVAVCTSCHLDSYVPYLASLYIGAICAVEYHQLPTRMFHRFLSMVKPKTIFLHECALENLRAAEDQLDVKIQRVLFEKLSNEAFLDDVLSNISSFEVEKFRCATIEDPMQTAVYIATSGSTGLPKIAELTHLGLKTLLHPAYAVDLVDKVSLCMAGLRWICGIVYTMATIRANSTRIIADDMKDMMYYEEIIRKYQVEYFSMRTTQMKEMYKLGLTDLYRSTNLKTIGFVGSPFSSDIHKTMIQLLPQIQLLQAYGSTDLGSLVTKQTSNDRCKAGSCGYVRDGVQMKMVNTETGKALGPNAQGEIYVKTVTQLKRYLNNPDATKKAIDSEGWLRTADIGYYDDDGELFIVGRTSDFIKYRDGTVSAIETENLLDQHPAVYKSAVVAVPDEVKGEVPVAVVIKLPGKEVSEHELIGQFASNMPEYYKLDSVKFVDEFPMTSTGKVAKHELKEKLFNGTL